MQIPQKLPQFEDSPSLLILSGFQAGKVFYALNGEIELDKEIDVPDHKYSDDEGFFQRMTSRIKGSMGSGSVKEKKKEHIREKYLNEFVSHIKSRVEELSIEDIYIFSPQEGLNSLKEELPNNIKDLIKSTYAGNYAHQNPKDLLQIIKDQKDEPVQVMSEEAKKILEKGEE